MPSERPGTPGTPDPDWDAPFPELEGLDGLDDPELERWASSRARRRHAGGARVVGLIVVVALIVASVGTTIELVLGGSSSSSGATLPTSITSTVPMGIGGTPLPGGTASSESAHDVQVAFTVTNPGGQSSVPVCSVDVYAHAGKDVAGSVTVHGDRAVPGGTTSAAKVTVPLPEAPPADALGRVTLTCVG